MANIKIDKQRCKGCCLCVAVCPRANIRMSELFNEAGRHYAEIIDEADCTGCALCCQMCPDLAIQINPSPAQTGSIKETAAQKTTRQTTRAGGKLK